MADAGEIKKIFQHYEALILPALSEPTPTLHEAESRFAVQIDRGLVLRDAVIARTVVEDRVRRLVELAGIPDLNDIQVVDRLGHHRPVYRPLLVYTWLLAFRIRYESLDREEFGQWDEALRAWSDLLESKLGPELGCETAWTALALHVAGKVLLRDAWTDLAADTFGRLARTSQTAANPSHHPETQWYDDLAALHAMASYAVQAEDRTIAAAVQRATEFHLQETQPDHATAQPWGLFAFIWNPATRPLADQLLHGVSLQQPRGLDAVSLILLSDCLYCLRLFL